MDVCKELDLQPGDVIQSAAWKKPRVLRQIDQSGVWVAEIREDGSMVSEQHVASLPDDSERFEHPTRRKRPL
jgi:hypothetical protein